MIRGGPFPRWWAQRSARERVLLGVMAAALAAYVIVVGVAEPLLARRAAALAAIARHDVALARLAALPDGDAAPAALASDQPVTAVVAETAMEYDLNIRRIEAEGDAALLEIEDAGFPEIILWIDALEREYGLRLVAIEMDRRPDPGIVSARLTLER